MKLKKIFQGIPNCSIKGSKECNVTGICANSTLVAPGNLYIAKKGSSFDGARFIPDAIAAGAVAILTDIYDPFFSHVTQIIHPHVSAIEAQVVATYHGFPDQSLLLVGITGTNGKTTCSYLVKHILDLSEMNCGLIGTIEVINGKNYIPAVRSTPDVTSNYKFLHEMVANGCKSACMEVTSHALDQGRVAGLDFDIAIFTNLNHEHLDYHLTMEKYSEAKAKLFSSLNMSSKKKYPKVAIMNQDSPYTQLLLKACPAKVLTYGILQKADFMAKDITLSEKGLRFTLIFEGKSYPVTSSLIGRFNVYNCLAALSFGVAAGIPLSKVIESLRSFSQVCGRLEKVPNKKGLSIYVDYAHKVDALQNVLSTLKEITKGKLITVFGCGGNRDIIKRPLMAKVSEELSDCTIVTSDNPRSEDPEKIIHDILQGFTSPSKAIVEINRKEAIRKAIQMAKKEDVIIIAGKGHETYQIFANQTIDFDDRKIAKELCE